MSKLFSVLSCLIVITGIKKKQLSVITLIFFYKKNILIYFKLLNMYTTKLFTLFYGKVVYDIKNKNALPIINYWIMIP